MRKARTSFTHSKINVTWSLFLFRPTNHPLFRLQYIWLFPFLSFLKRRVLLLFLTQHFSFYFRLNRWEAKLKVTNQVENFSSILHQTPVTKPNLIKQLWLLSFFMSLYSIFSFNCSHFFWLFFSLSSSFRC